MEDDAGRLVIMGDVRELRRMSEWIARRSACLGLSGTARENLEVCANEAIANVIFHGGDAPRDCGIVLAMDRAGNDVTLEISDNGVPFDPLAMPAPETPATLDDASLGGLGVPLIRGLLPRSRYARIEGRNVLTLVAPVTG